MLRVKGVEPAEYILSILPSEERLETALKIANEAFKKTSLHLEDIEAAVKKIRRRTYEKRAKNKSCR